MSQTENRDVTVIGPDTHIKGEMVFENTACILGTFEGRIAAKGEIQIGSTAQCQASIEAQTVVVDGTVEGDIVAHDCLQLNSSARVSGDLVANTLVVAEGASFVGQCRVGPGTVQGENPLSTQQQQSARGVERPRVTSTMRQSDLHTKLAGLEAKLAGINGRQTND